MQKPIIIVFLMLAFTGLTVIGVSMFNQLACEGQPINNNVNPTRSQQILGEQIISQSFVAPQNHLNRVDIFFQTYQRQNNRDVTLRLLETTSDKANPLAGIELFKTTINAATIRDQSWRTFTFPPIADSANKTYLINLQSPESADGNAVTVGGIERDVYAPGSAYLGSVPVRADITFRACFQLTISEKTGILAEQLTHNRPAVWSIRIFYGLFLGTYGLVLLSFLGYLARLALNREA